MGAPAKIPPPDSSSLSDDEVWFRVLVAHVGIRNAALVGLDLALEEASAALRGDVTAVNRTTLQHREAFYCKPTGATKDGVPRFSKPRRLGVFVTVADSTNAEAVPALPVRALARLCSRIAAMTTEAGRPLTERTPMRRLLVAVAAYWRATHKPYRPATRRQERRLPGTSDRRAATKESAFRDLAAQLGIIADGVTTDYVTRRLHRAKARLRK